MTARAWYSPEAEAARTLDLHGRIRHGRSGVGLGARVATRAGEVGVIVALESSVPGLMLRVVWLPPDHTSRRAASAVARAYSAGLRDAVSVPAAGLVAIEAWLDPHADACLYSDPFHFGYCLRPIGGESR